MASHDNAQAPSVGAATERRVALVIGNSHYRSASELRSSADDARAISAALGRLGFDVIEGFELDLHRFGEVHGAFEEKLESQPEVALLFYVGHAAQVSGGEEAMGVCAPGCDGLWRAGVVDEGAWEVLDASKPRLLALPLFDAMDGYYFSMRRVP
jgi:hypothetical protein